MKKILCATDFSRRSDLAIDRAAILARQFGAELVLLNVVDDDEPRPMVDHRFEQARTALVASAARILEDGTIHANVEAQIGTPFATIVDAAQASGVDLIVMGAPRRRLLRDVIVGTTTERVLRNGNHPVLVVNAAARARYESVLVALDASNASSRALRVSKALGLLDGAQVSVVHAFEPVYKGMMSWAGLGKEAIESYSENWARDAAAELRRFLDSIGFADSARHVLLEEGPPFPSIRKVTERIRPHLLVMGTRGHTGLKRLLLGSVAERVVSEIECDILAVPPMTDSGGQSR